MHDAHLSAIRNFEGFTAKANWDYAQNTNGYGTKAKYAGEVIDKAEAERRFKSEISDAAAKVEKFAPNLDSNTKAALTSLTFNAGTKWMTSGLGAAIRAGDLETARQRFVLYNRAGGEVLPGLASRRLQEVAWFQTAAPSPAAAAQASTDTPPTAGTRIAMSTIVPSPEPVKKHAHLHHEVRSETASNSSTDGTRATSITQLMQPVLAGIETQADGDKAVSASKAIGNVFPDFLAFLSRPAALAPADRSGERTRDEGGDPFWRRSESIG